jgi:hypothetical protein
MGQSEGDADGETVAGDHDHTVAGLREATYDYEVLPPEEILYAADLRSSRLAGNRGNPYWCDPVWRETK